MATKSFTYIQSFQVKMRTSNRRLLLPVQIHTQPALNTNINHHHHRKHRRKDRVSKNMTTDFNLSLTIHSLRNKAGQPYEFGQICGTLMEMIPLLVKVHLDHDATYTSSQKFVHRIDTQEFIAAVDKKLADMRVRDDVTSPFPDALSRIDKKQRKFRKQYCDRYTTQIQRAFGEVLAEGLGDVLGGLSAPATEQFNKGLDYGLNHFTWRVYPSANVVLEAAGDEWSNWLSVRCKSLALVALRTDLPVFDA